MQELKKSLPQLQSRDPEKTLSDLGAERAILACLMKEPAKMVEASIKQLSPDHFHLDNNRYLYGIMLFIFNKKSGKDCHYDISTLMSKAKEKGLDEDFTIKSGGDRYIAYLTSMQDSQVDLGSFSDYVDTVISLATKRKLYGNLQDLQEEVLSSNAQPEELLIRGQKDLSDILNSSVSTNNIVNLGQRADKFLKESCVEKKKILGLPTEFPVLDDTIEGLKRGNLLIVAAPRKTGKSAFLLNVGLNVSFVSKAPVLMISTEMSHEEILSRSLAKLSDVQEKRILKNDLTKEEESYVQVWKANFEKSKFYHVEMRSFTLEKIIATVRRFVNENVGFREDGKPKDCLVIFDYIKMPGAGVSSSQELKEYKLLGQIADGLKVLAGDLDIPILTACQTNRTGEVANSYELTWFCNTFMVLTNKTPQQMDKEGMGQGPGGNQVLKIIANRGGEENYEGISFDYNKPTLRYIEVLGQGKSFNGK